MDLPSNHAVGLRGRYVADAESQSISCIRRVLLCKTSWQVVVVNLRCQQKPQMFEAETEEDCSNLELAPQLLQVLQVAIYSLQSVKIHAIVCSRVEFSRRSSISRSTI